MLTLWGESSVLNFFSSQTYNVCVFNFPNEADFWMGFYQSLPAYQAISKRNVIDIHKWDVLAPLKISRLRRWFEKMTSNETKKKYKIEESLPQPKPEGRLPKDT